MHRSQQSRKRHQSSSFIKFVARIQRTFSSKNLKSSTRIVTQLPSTHPVNSTPVPIFPTFSNQPRCRLSQILYDPLHQIEYLSEIEEKTNSDISEQSVTVDDNDSCYDSMSEHRNDRLNLSLMNVSIDELNYRQSQQMKHCKLPYSLENARFHSTAINDIGNY